MKDEQLLRYSRQILLPEIDLDGQERLLEAQVTIFGLGGLGSPAAMYLAAAGVGELVLVDFDTVELSNLQRQIVHSNHDLQRPKVESAADRLRALNPDVVLTLINTKLDGERLREVVASATVVVDATDNFASRYALNLACYQTQTPLISGAATRFNGQVSVFYPGLEDNPCYRCLFSDADDLNETCSDTGVIAPLLGIVGSIQALEAMKIITATGKTLGGRLLLLDAYTMEWRTVIFKRDPLCETCGKAAQS